MKKNVFLIITVAFSLTVAAQQRSTFTDSRDDKIYKTVTIGKQVWMAENLNYITISGSWCYNDDSVNCNKYGRLYDWNTARIACPSGWHLPSDAEWTTLTNFVGSDAGKKLKSTTGWTKNGNGTDAYGFSVLPGGGRYNGGGFGDVGGYGYWWSATEYSATDAWYRDADSDYSSMDRDYNSKDRGYSVRCLRNN